RARGTLVPFFWVAQAVSLRTSVAGSNDASNRLRRKMSGRVLGTSQANSLRYIRTLLNSIIHGGTKLSLVIYTKPGCPYCQQARDYYNSKGIAFIDRDAQTNREYRAEMFKYSGDDPTVPCIVEDGKYLQSGWGDPLRGRTVH